MAKRADGTYTSRAGAEAAQHRAEREAWAPAVATGTVECRRGVLCRAPSLLIGSDEDWDLGHPDHVCKAPTGPEHVGCNRATATWKAAARKRPAPIHPSQLTRHRTTP